MRAPRSSVALLVALGASACAGARASRPPPLVAVDAGHTAAAPGAIGARGTRERDLNVAVARALAAALDAAGLRSALVAADDDVANPERPREAGRLGAAALVSIHHDSVQPRYLATWRHDGATHAYSDRFRGFSLFVAGGARLDESVALARAIADALLAAGFTPSLHHAEPIPGEGRPLLDAARGIHRFDELAVLRLSPLPAVLVECGVLVNRAEEIELASPARQRAFAMAVARGVARWARPDAGGRPAAPSAR